MADLSYIQATLETKIVGQDSTGNNVNYVGADSTGHMTVVNPSEGATGSAVPTQAMTVGGTDGTNLRAITTDTSGNQKVVGNVAAGTTDSGNGVKVSGVFETTVPILTNGQRGDIQLDSRSAQMITPLDGSRATYCATNTFAAAATPTDIFTINGSGTKTVRILRIGISATQTTAAIIGFTILKRSTADTGGTSTTLTAVPMDSNNAAATASVKSYTANPTALGVLVGNIRNIKLLIPVVAVGGNTSSQPEYIATFGDRPGQALVLRGTGDTAALNLNSTTISGNSFDVWVEWTEE